MPSSIASGFWKQFGLGLGVPPAHWKAVHWPTKVPTKKAKKNLGDEALPFWVLDIALFLASLWNYYVRAPMCLGNRNQTKVFRPLCITAHEHCDFFERSLVLEHPPYRALPQHKSAETRHFCNSVLQSTSCPCRNCDLVSVSAGRQMCRSAWSPWAPTKWPKTVPPWVPTSLEKLVGYRGSNPDKILSKTGGWNSQ